MYITRNLFIKFTSYVFYFLFQDVMLSATTTQSPLATQSSVFTIPSVSMGTGGINLTDHLFLPSMSALDPTHGTADTKSDHNGRLCMSCYCILCTNNVENHFKTEVRLVPFFSTLTTATSQSDTWGIF